MIRPPTRALQAEERRRQQWTAALQRAVLAEFVVDKADAEGAGRFVVRRLEVYRTAAEHFRIAPISVAFCIEVANSVRVLGVIPVKVGNRALFRGMHRREICPAQAAVESTTLRAVVTNRASSRGGDGREGGRETWEERLRAEGMPPELESAGLIDETRARINESRIAAATDAFWETDKVRLVLLHYLKGDSIREIVAKTGVQRHSVHRMLHKRGLVGTSAGDV